MTYKAWTALKNKWFEIKQAMLGFDDDANPIKYEDGAWWFWDECWCTKYGPFESESEAKMGLKQYVKDYL